MVEPAKRIDATYAYDASTYSSVILDVPNLSLVLAEVSNTQPSTTTTIGFLTRDLIEFDGGFNLYRYVHCSPLVLFDPMGNLAIDPIEKELLKNCTCDWVNTTPKKDEAESWVGCDGKGNFKVLGRSGGEGIADYDCAKLCGATDCIIEHAKHHIEKFKLACPDACKGGCGFAPVGGTMAIEKGLCQSVSECYAGDVHLLCLIKKHAVEENAKTKTSCRGKSCSTWYKTFFDRYRTAWGKKYDCKDRYTLKTWPF